MIAATAAHTDSRRKSLYAIVSRNRVIAPLLELLILKYSINKIYLRVEKTPEAEGGRSGLGDS